MLEFKLKNPSDAARWEELLSSFPNADVYYRSAYVLACSELEPSEPIGLVISAGEQQFLVPMLVRTVAGPSEQSWHDAVSPYGYGGVLCKPFDGRKEIVASFFRQLNTWCADRHVVCCVLRSHPLLGQEWLFDRDPQFDFLQVKRGTPTVAVNLQEWDRSRRCPAHLHRSPRSYLSFSRRSLQITWNEVDSTESTLEQFRVFEELYGATMMRLGADSFFFFPPAYYRRLSELGREIGIAIAWLGERPVGAAVFMAGPTFAHYHLSATDETSRKYRAATLLVVEGAEWARQRGCKLLHLGGGMQPNDSLLRFKQSLGGFQCEYGSLTLITDPSRYEAMCEAENPRWPYLKETEHSVDTLTSEERPVQHLSGVLKNDVLMKDLVIIGAGGLAREAAFLAAEMNRVRPEWNILGFLDLDADSIGTKIGSYSVVGTDRFLEDYPGEIYAIIAIGVPNTIRRLVEQIPPSKNVHFPNLIHPSVSMDLERVTLGQGNMIFAGSHCTTDIQIGSFNVINLGCTVGHDTRIGNYNVISPGVNICGGVVIGDACLIGTGVSILPCKQIADSAVVGAGFVVAQDVKPGLTIDRLLWAKRLLSEDASKPMRGVEFSSRIKDS